MRTKLFLFKVDKTSELSEALDGLLANAEVDLMELSTIEDLKTQTNKLGRAIILFELHNRDEVKEAVALLRRHSLTIKKGKLKFVLLQKERNPKIESLLVKYGCTEFIDQDIKAKSLLLKMNFWLKNVQKEEQRVSQNEVKSEKDSLESSPQALGAKFKIINSKTCTSDVWLFEKVSAKKVLRKWLIHLQGPSSLVANWKDCRNGTWEFIIDPAHKNEFYEGAGNWFFRGQRPEFDWKLTCWVFSSHEPHLFFEDATQNKFFVQGTKLFLRKNSIFANALKDKILASAESKVSIEKNRLRENKRKESFSKDNHISTHMEGETKTEHMAGHYKGKTEGKTSKKGSGEFNLKLENLDGLGKEMEISLEDTTGTLINFTQEKERRQNEDDAKVAQVTEEADIFVRLSHVDSQKVYLCKFGDLFEDQLSVSLSKDSISLREKFSITLSLNYGDKKVSIATIGEITHVEDNNYTLKINEISSKELEKFMELYEERQENINEFMKMVRGF